MTTHRLTLLTGALCALVLVAGCTAKDTPKDTAGQSNPDDSLVVLPASVLRSGQVKRDAAVSQALADTLALSGEIAADPLRMVHVGARVSGVMQAVYAVAGTPVRPGQILATVHSPEFLAAQSDFLLAFGRAERAHALPPAEREPLETVAHSARRRLEVLGAAAADLSTIERTHDTVPYLTLRAPRAGVVTEVQAAVGKQLTAGDDLFGITDLSHLWAVVSAHEQDLADLRPGQNARVTTTAFGARIFPGRVSTLEGALDEATRTLKVRITLANADGALRPGMFVTGHIASGRVHQAVVVPEAAIQDYGGGKVVFVAHGESSFVARPVVVMSLGGERVQILRGLTAGTVIATHGAFLVRSQAQKSQMGEE